MRCASIVGLRQEIMNDSDGIGDQRSDYRNGQTVGTIPAGAAVLVAVLGEIAETAFPLKNHKPPKSNAVLWLWFSVSGISVEAVASRHWLVESFHYTSEIKLHVFGGFVAVCKGIRSAWEKRINCFFHSVTCFTTTARNMLQNNNTFLTTLHTFNN